MRPVITRRNSASSQACAPGDIAPAGPAASFDSYRERLVKYVPVEVIVLYVGAYGTLYAVGSADPWFAPTVLWLLVAGILAVPLYLWKVEGVRNGIQLAISTAGFLLFALALGVVPLSTWPGYNQVVASVALPAYVFLSPLIEGMPDRW